MPELLQIANADLNQRPSVRLFESGRIFEPVAGEVLPQEQRQLAIVLAGARTTQTGSSPDTGMLDFFDLKGVVENLLARLRIEGVEWTRAQDDRFHPGRAALLLRTTGWYTPALGICGELHPDARNRIGFTVGRVCAAELDLDALLDATPARALPTVHNQPAVYQDLAVVAPIASRGGARATGYRSACRPAAGVGRCSSTSTVGRRSRLDSVASPSG